MADPKHLAILKQGVDTWNPWRQARVGEWMDLKGADLVGVNLAGASLHDTRFDGAILRGANLEGADLAGADFNGSDLRGANLRRTTLFITKFRMANLSGVDLRWAVLHWVIFTGANLQGAIFHETVLADTDLAGATGLDSCQHFGPSSVDYRTLLRAGPLPVAFLRGIGLPDRMTDYLPSLFAGEVIQRYACFITYSTKDQAFASRLYSDLQRNGVRCWFAPEDAAGGKKLHSQIDEAIQTFDKSAAYPQRGQHQEQLGRARDKTRSTT